MKISDLDCVVFFLKILLLLLCEGGGGSSLCIFKKKKKWGLHFRIVIYYFMFAIFYREVSLLLQRYTPPIRENLDIYLVRELQSPCYARTFPFISKWTYPSPAGISSDSLFKIVR